MKAIILISIAIFGVQHYTQSGTEHPDTDEGRLGTAEVGGESVDIRLAESKLQLAQLELQRAQEINRRVSGTVQETTLQRLQQSVEVATKVLEFSRGEEQELHAVHLLQLEAEVKLANRQLKSAIEANRLAPGIVSATGLERFRLRAEVARLTLARAREASGFESTEAHLQWQVDHLYDEVQRLRNDIPQLAQPK